MSEIIEQMGSHYAKTWDEFIGQDPVKRQLKLAAQSARIRGKRMQHTFITGAPGQGKTSLALLIARELNTNVTIITEPIKPAKAPYVLMDMKDGDILFLDEVHKQAQGGKQNMEWLYHLMENDTINGPLGSEGAAKITIVAATTDGGRLPAPFKDRFPLKPVLEPYSDEEGVHLARALAIKVLVAEGMPLPTTAVAAAVAQAGNNSPRHIRNIWSAVLDLTVTGEITPKKGVYDLTEAFAFAGVSADGLDVEARRYLVALLKDFRAEPTGQRTLADRLGLVGDGVKEVERVLLNKELIGFTKGGRMLTPAGMRRARDLAA